MNSALGNIGKTVTYIDPVEAIPRRCRPNRLRRSSPTCNAGTVELLLMLGGNPVYDAPADLEFADALQTQHDAGKVHRASQRVLRRNVVTANGICR